MANKTNIGLVAWAKEWLGRPYWYGTCCYKCTASLLASKTAQYPTHYTEARKARYQQDIKNGESCADCIGLMKGYLWEKDGKSVYDGNTDVNTTGLYNRATIKGLIGSMPEVPGLIVYKSGHVGVYEGNGSVIEAKGFANGIIRSRLTDTAWTHWIAFPWISYEGYESLITPGAGGFPYTAKVVTNSTPLNIWTNASKKASLAQVPKGDTLTVTGYAETAGWYKVTKNGVSGVSDGQYLLRMDEPPTEPEPEEPGCVLLVDGFRGGPLRSETAMNLMGELASAGYSVTVRAKEPGEAV